LRTSDEVRTLFLLGSITGVVIGARHVLNYLSEQRKNSVAETPRKTPRRRTRRTAQQVSPRRVSRASPRGVA
jgi:predicted patatin/cPLA2 family phospholipase